MLPVVGGGGPRDFRFPVHPVRATSAQGGDPPAKPTGLSSTATNNSVTLSWDDTGDDSITGYVILRRNPSTHEPGMSACHEHRQRWTTYTDSTVAAKTRYGYRIKAVNAYGEIVRAAGPVKASARWTGETCPGRPHTRCARTWIAAGLSCPLGGQHQRLRGDDGQGYIFRPCLHADISDTMLTTFISQPWGIGNLKRGLS